jgi:predicted nucleic acid-binding protein
MLILADTNLLLRLVEAKHAQRPIAAEAIDVVRKLGHRLVIVPQVVYEFWAVGTRPAELNGLGLSSVQMSGKLDGLMPSFKLLLDERSIFEIWQRLVLDHDVKGKQVHDARIVAAMLRHDISHLLTFNGPDFARYSAVTAIEPRRASELGPAK